MADERAANEGWVSPNRGKRLRLLADAYGCTPEQRLRLVETVLLKHQMGFDSHRRWAEDGIPAFVAMVNQGSLELIQADIDWVKRNYVALVEFLQ